jgi:DNA gyrase subunit A
MQEEIQEIPLRDTTRERYLNYALSVITARALPDVRDGLKPVQRRILYAMYHNLRLTAEAKHKKSAAVVGEVMSKYHPHGDQSIYDAMVRMAQGWVLRYRLVDGQGNFGSVDGDNPAAMRYTEARLDHIAEELLSELRKDTVDMRANYDGTLMEPVALPAQIPNLLINGASGIAVGMATNIPPHNLREVISALVALIDDPSLSLERIVRDHVRGPDFPTGGQILSSEAELLEMYETGNGPVEMRGEWTLETEGHRRSIIVTSVPYGVNKSQLVSEIAELIAKEKVPQLTDVRDESTEEVRVVLDLKRGANPEAAMAYLYRKTQIQKRFAVNMTALCPVEGSETCQPRRLGLREILTQFLDFRFVVTRRRLAYDLAQLEKRIHLLRGFALIFDGLDEAIRLIRESEGKNDARDKLMARFGLDWEQAEAILETKLYRLARLEIDAIRAELAEKEAEAAELRAVLGSETATWTLIRGELAQIADAYADERRSKLTGPVREQKFTEEVYIVSEDAFVIVTRQGRLKRQKSYTDLSAIRVAEGDEVGWVLPSNTRESLMLFTSVGKAYTMRVADVTQTTGYGEIIQTRFDFEDGEHVVGAAVSDPRSLPEIPEEIRATIGEADPPPPYAVAITRKGRGMRFSLAGFTEPSTVAGRRYLRLGGPGKGVTAIKIGPSDSVIGYKLVIDKMDGLEVETSRGRVEVLRSNKFKVGSRGGKGRELVSRGNLTSARWEPVEVRWEREDDGSGAEATTPATTDATTDAAVGSAEGDGGTPDATKSQAAPGSSASAPGAGALSEPRLLPRPVSPYWKPVAPDAPAPRQTSLFGEDDPGPPRAGAATRPPDDDDPGDDEPDDLDEDDADDGDDEPESEPENES